MIDIQKTDLLRKKLKEEREGPSPEATPKQEDSMTTLLLFAGKYFMFHGAQWLLFTKLNITPFGLLESLILLLGIRAVISSNIVKPVNNTK